MDKIFVIHTKSFNDELSYMKIKTLSIDGLKLITLQKFSDERGFFIERFHKDKFKELGLQTEFIQDNHSFSLPNVIRGLHFQSNPAQGKLVGVLKGKILDIAVDIRLNSPTFGKYESVELSEENNQLLWLPAGFAHGFMVIGNEPAHVSYKVDGRYSPETDGGIVFNDSDLNIQWPLLSEPIVSQKDKNLKTFKEYCKNPVFKI